MGDMDLRRGRKGGGIESGREIGRKGDGCERAGGEREESKRSWVWGVWRDRSPPSFVADGDNKKGECCAPTGVLELSGTVCKGNAGDSIA